MALPGRKYFATGSYRYGFNGKENDNDVKGEGNQQDYGMRIYDPRLGRFLSVDPLTDEYPWYTPFQFAGNMPIWAIDLDGLEPAYSGWNSNGQYVNSIAGDNLRHTVPISDRNLLPQCQGCGVVTVTKQDVSLILDLIPGVGTAKGLFESITGEDLITGEKKSALDRTLGIIPYFGKVKKIVNVVKAVDKIEEVVKIEKNIVKSNKAVQSSEKGIVQQKKLGDAREVAEEANLKKQYPGADIQNQQYLRDANGKIMKDPVTGEARRLDHVVIENGKSLDVVETTSQTANKKNQVEKEERIRNAGGTNVRDRKTKKIIPVSQSRISRHN